VLELLEDFSETYAEADAKFVARVRAAGAQLTAHIQPGTGPQGERLVTRVARFGPVEANRVLFVESGTHGIEGYCGSGAQLGWVRTGRMARPREVAVVLIHAINPHGFAWGRRETAEGVDLNRNFIDHDVAAPINAGYELLHSAFLCPQLEGPLRDEADAKIATFREEHGEAAFMEALAKGQYTHAGGLYYGGDAPTWSNQALRTILEDEAGAASRVGFIDLHSGLGPFGYGMPICLEAAASDALARVRAAFGESVVAPYDEEDSLVPEVRGHVLEACAQQLSGAEVTAVALEFGTYSIDNDTNTYRDRLWLDAQGDFDSAQGRDIRAAFRRHFYPEAADWKEMMWTRTQQVIRQGLAALR
jgi:hypothetical protein